MQQEKVDPPLNSHNLQELEDLIPKILSRNIMGLPAKKIGGSLPPAYTRAKKQLPAVLDDLLAGARIHSWQPPPGKSKAAPPVYSIEPLFPVVSDHIVQMLKLKAMSPSDLKKHFPAHIKTNFMLFLEPLLRDRTVKWHPPVGKTRKLSLDDPDPAEFLGSEIKKVFDKGRRLGFADAVIVDALHRHSLAPAEKMTSSLSPLEIENTVFKAMALIKPSASQGALVYIPDLRNALRAIFPDKESFDRAIMELARSEKVQLQSHSLPDSLSEDQKAAMIDNRRGSYFMAVGIRME